MALPRFLARLFENSGAGPKLLGSILPFGTSLPKAHGTASVGTADEAARADHVHPLQTTVAGNANTATKLQNARKINISGDAAGTAQVFDGSKDAIIPVTISDMTGASANAAGARGFVPAPVAGAANRYLRSDGTWAVPPDNNTTYGAATQSANGLMSADDKKKLDGIAAGATNTAAPPAAASAAPKAHGTAAVGTSAKYAREDHVHPAQTIPGNMKGATASAAGTAGLAPAPIAGEANRYLRSDGKWAVPPSTTYGAATQSANGLMSAADKKKLDGIASGATNTAAPPAAASAAPKAHGTAAVGTSAKYAREDHVHPAQTIPGNMKGATASEAGTAGLAPAPVAGAANRYLRSDGKWAVPPDNNTTYSAATQSASGLMSADDKKKLDGIASGAQANPSNIISAQGVSLSSGQINACKLQYSSDNVYLPSGGSYCVLKFAFSQTGFLTNGYRNTVSGGSLLQKPTSDGSLILYIIFKIA